MHSLTTPTSCMQEQAQRSPFVQYARVFFLMGVFFYPFRHIVLFTPMSNLFFAVSFLSLAARYRSSFILIPGRDREVRVLGLFFIYAFIVNLAWSIYFSSFVTAKFYIFMLFNFLVFISFIHLHRIYKKELLKNLVFVILISIIILIIQAIPLHQQIFKGLVNKVISPGGVSRLSLFFANANSLGYFSVLSLALVLGVGKSKKIRIFIFSTVSFLILISLSRSAMIAFFALSLSLFFRNTLPFILAILGSGVCILTIRMFFLDIYNWLPIKISLFMRIAYTGLWHQDGLSERGFDIFAHAWKHLLWGVSEAYVFEHRSLLYNVEPHGSIFYTLANYGLIGTGLLFVFHLSLLKNTSKRMILLFIGVSVYGLFNNGLRSPFYWIFLGTLFVHSSSSSNLDADRLRVVE